MHSVTLKQRKQVLNSDSAEYEGRARRYFEKMGKKCISARQWKGFKELNVKLAWAHINTYTKTSSILVPEYMAPACKLCTVGNNPKINLPDQEGLATK